MDTLSTINNGLQFSRRVGRFGGGGGRGGSPFGCCGIGLILMSAALLFWNEGRAVRRYAILQDGARAVVEVTNIDVVDPANEGELVHLVGITKNNGMLHDKEFGVTAAEALKLQRSVRMFQWVEHSDDRIVTKPDGSTGHEVTYSYTKAWSTDVINSNHFHEPDGHVNPDQMMFSPKLESSDTVLVGAYHASKDMVNSMNWFNYKTDGISVDNIVDPAIKAKAKPVDGGFYFSSGNNTELELPACVCYYNATGCIPLNEETFTKGKKDVACALDVLESHLRKGSSSNNKRKIPQTMSTYLVNPERVTLADIVVTCILVYPFTLVFDKADLESYPNVVLWFQNCMKEPEFVTVLGKIKCGREVNT